MRLKSYGELFRITSIDFGALLPEALVGEVLFPLDRVREAGHVERVDDPEHVILVLAGLAVAALLKDEAGGEGGVRRGVRRACSRPRNSKMFKVSRRSKICCNFAVARREERQLPASFSCACARKKKWPSRPHRVPTHAWTGASSYPTCLYLSMLHKGLMSYECMKFA